MTTLTHDAAPLAAARSAGSRPARARPGIITAAVVIQALLLLYVTVSTVGELAGMARITPTGDQAALVGAVVGGIAYIAIGAMLVRGLFTGSVLAQRLVLLGAGWAVLSTVLALPRLESIGASMMLLLVAWGAVRALQFYWLTRPEAKVWFGLDCPACGSQKTRGASLLYRKLRCRSCDHVWDRTARETIDVEAFD